MRRPFDSHAPAPLRARRLSTRPFTDNLVGRGSLAEHVVEIPNWSHNVLGDGGGCAIGIRNAWLDDPTSPPATSCTTGLPPIDFQTE
jgi:hypothetical protein